MSPNSKQTLRFFGNYAPNMPHIPVPLGMRCVHCDRDFGAADEGMMFVRGRACVVSHRWCYVRAALLRWKREFARDETDR